MMASSSVSTDRVRRSRAAGLLVLFLAGATPLSCENEITIRGTVTVPVDVQRQFSATMRGMLVMMAGYADNGSYIDGRTIYIFCEPGTADLTLPFQLYSLGCVREAYTDAIVMPLSGRQAETFASLPCGEVSERPGDGTSVIARGRSLAFDGRKGGRCTSGTAVADLAVALKK
jgi:hypothetical protein